MAIILSEVEGIVDIQPRIIRGRFTGHTVKFGFAEAIRAAIAIHHGAQFEDSNGRPIVLNLKNPKIHQALQLEAAMQS